MLKSIKHWLKKYFIPHEHNDHKPHFLRSETTVIVIGFVLFVEVAFLLEILVLFPNTNFFASILPAVLVDETNSGRMGNALEELKINPLLQEAARLKANDMAAKSYFSHESPEGKTPWYWLEQAGYEYVYAGENLAVNFIDSEDVVVAWMNSPAHRANMLNDKFSEIGIAAARGTYEGRETTFVVQFFGKPVLAALPPGEAITQTEQIVPVPDTATSAPELMPQVKGETNQLEPAVTVNKSSVLAKIFSQSSIRNLLGTAYLFFQLSA